MFSVLCSLNLYPGPNTQLAIFFFLLITPPLVSVIAYYSDFPPAGPSFSVSLLNVCVHSSVLSHPLFLFYTVSWTISSFLLASLICFMKTAHVYLEAEFLLPELVSFPSPTG